MPAIDRGMVLVAEGGNGDVALLRLSLLGDLGLGELHRPARVAVLLAQLGGLLLPLIRNLARLDVGLLGIAIALLRRRHDRGVDDLPAHRQIASLGEVLVEAGEQVLHRAGLREKLAEQPDRLGIRNPSPSPRPRKRMNESRSWIWNSA